MPVGQDKILGPKGANMMGDDGKLTKAARERFCTEVLALQVAGNANGLGISKFNPLLPIPIPPIPGPPLPSINGPSPLFWFKPEPWALLSAPAVLNPDGAYQKLIVDGLYAPLVKMLNLDGKTSLGPVFDPTIFLDLSKFPDLKIPDLPGILAQLVVLGNLSQILPLPGIPAKLILLTDFGIGDPKLVIDLVPLILAPPIPKPPIPEIPLPPSPSVPNPGLPSFFLPDLVLGLFKLPLTIFPQLIGDISIDLDPLALIVKIIKIIVDFILSLLKDLFLAPLTLLAATLSIIIKNLAGMILCDLVGSLLGTGAIVKIVGSLVGLA
jgi:hypothetical protein